MQKNAARKIGILALLLLALPLLFYPGCVQYNANAEQKFVENGTAYLTVREHVRVDETLVGEYAATIQNDSNSKIGDALVGGIIAYYNTGEYAKDLCKRAVGVSCTFSQDGEVVWNTTLQPDGRFYNYHSETDWISMDRVTTYDIRRVPMLHFQAYQQKTTDETAKLEWEGLRSFLQNYLGEVAGDDKDAQAQIEKMLSVDGPLRKSIDRYAPLRVPEQILDLETGQIRARNFDSQKSNSSAPKLLYISFSYLVQTFDPIVKASMGSASIVPEAEKQLRLTMDETQYPPKGRLMIITKKSLSPIGVYTWVIPIVGILFTLAREVLLGSKKIWKEEK